MWISEIRFPCSLEMLYFAWVLFSYTFDLLIDLEIRTDFLIDWIYKLIPRLNITHMQRKCIWDHNMRFLNWLAHSPALNLIENLWSELVQRMTKCKCNSEVVLFEDVKRKWYQLDNKSLPKRCAGVVRSQGHPIDYWATFKISLLNNLPDEVYQHHLACMFTYTTMRKNSKFTCHKTRPIY